MKNMIATSFKLFTRNKAFLFSVTVVPTLLFLLMSVLLPYTEKHSVSVINKTDSTVIENSIKDIDGINLVEVEEDKIPELIARGTIEMAVIIAEEPSSGTAVAQIISSGDCEVYEAVKLAVDYASDSSSSDVTTVNSVKRGKHNLLNTLSFMLYKFIESAGVLGAMIIADRKKHIKDRILLSGVHPVKYVGSISLVYFVYSCVGSAVYCLVAMVMKYDFGMKTPIHYFIMLCLANLFSVSFYVFAASISDSEEALQGMGTLILVSSFISGLLFPFDYMPKAFKAIGNCCPQRWVVKGVENIRETGAFSSALPQVCLLLAFSVVFLTVGIYRNCHKTYK